MRQVCSPRHGEAAGTLDCNLKLQGLAAIIGIEVDRIDANR
jgi:hypothetical protein